MIRKIIDALKPKPKLYRYRCAMTGRIVSKRYAEKHPDVTVKERIDG